MKITLARTARQATSNAQRRLYSSQTASPRHLLSIADLTPTEFSNLVRNAADRKRMFKTSQAPLWLSQSLVGQTVAMTFSKRSTRTRVSTEAAVAKLGGTPLFLGKNDIQLGVGELIGRQENWI